MNTKETPAGRPAAGDAGQRRGSSRRLQVAATTAFWLVAAAFATVQIGGTLISPLFPLYQRQLGFGPLLVTIIFAVYALSVIGSLVAFGRMSDQLGRRPVLLAGLVFEVASATVFAAGHGLAVLFIGRVLAGIAGGVFTGTATATLVELAGSKRGAQATVVAGASNNIGLGLGPLLAGILAQLAPSPLRTPFVVLIGLTVLVTAGVWAMPETAQVPEHPHPGISMPKLPPEVRSVFTRASIAIFSGGAVVGLFTAVAPSFLVVLLHVQSHVLSGVVTFSVCAAAALGQIFLMGRLGRWAQAAGSALLVIGMIVLACALATSSLTLVIVSGVLGGAGQGISFGSGLRAVNAASSDDARGGVDSSVYIVLFTALALPAVGEGVAAYYAGPKAAAIAFSIIVAVVGAVACVSLWPRRPAAA